MKRIFTFIFVCTVALGIYGQDVKTAGVIMYERVVKLELKMQGGDAEMAALLPKERKSKQELLFNTAMSLYHNVVSDDADAEVAQESAGGRTIMIKMYDPDEAVFSDLKEKKNIEQREFMGRKFLIETNTDTLRWKITGNQKSIMGYNCLEAELSGSDKKIVAWFTPEISVSTGPDGYCGLPGLILSVNIDNDKTIITATNIELKDIDPKEIVTPKEGKKVSRNEFQKIVEEKTKEMQTNGGGVFIIRHEN